MVLGGRVMERAPAEKLALLWARLGQQRAPTEKVGLQLAGSLLAGGAATTMSSAQWASCSNSGGAAIAAAAAAAQQTGKAYVVKPSMLDPFAPMALAQVLLVGAAIPFNAQLGSATERFSQGQRKEGGEVGVTHNENGEPLTPFNLIDMNKMKVECAYNCAKSMTNKLLLKAVHLALWNYLDGEGGQHQIAKIIKDVAASAERKALRAADHGGGNLSAASQIASTYVKGAMLTWLICHLVEFGWGFSGLPQGRDWRTNLKYLLRTPLVLCGGATGATLGTAVWPGLGTGLGALAGELLPDILAPNLCTIPPAAAEDPAAATR